MASSLAFAATSLPVQALQREKERREAAAQHEHADDHADDVRKSGQQHGHQRGQEHPEAHEGHSAERSKPQTRVDAADIPNKMVAAETVETQLQRGVRPQEAPDRDPENKPCRSSDGCRRPAVANKRFGCERNRRCGRSDDGADDAVHPARPLAGIGAERVRRLRAECLQPPARSAPSPTA